MDTNKGDDKNPNHRSRIVAREFNNHKRDDLFAATPPLEAIKIRLSGAVAKGMGYQDIKKKGMNLDFIDVRRAYYHADALREVYVVLPPGDRRKACVDYYPNNYKVLLTLPRIGRQQTQNS